MRERTEPAPLAPQPPRWPGPGLRPGLGPAAARAGGCREARVGVRSGLDRRGGAFPRPFRSVPAPQEGAPLGSGALRHGRRSTGRAVLPSLRRVGRRGGSRKKWSGSVPSLGAPGGARCAALPGSREEERGAGPELELPSRNSPIGAACGEPVRRVAVRGALLPEPGRPCERRASGFGGLLSSPDALTGSAPLQLWSTARANGARRCAPRAAGRGGAGGQRCGSRAADQVRAGFVRRILPLGRAAREEIMYFSTCVEASGRCVGMQAAGERWVRKCQR